MTELKVGRSYQTSEGYIIPRSQMSTGNGVKYAIFEILELKEGGRYIKKHTTLDAKGIRKALELGRNERITII